MVPHQSGLQLLVVGSVVVDMRTRQTMPELRVNRQAYNGPNGVWFGAAVEPVFGEQGGYLPSLSPGQRMTKLEESIAALRC